MKTSFLKCARPSDKFPPFSFLAGNRSVVVSDDDLSLVKKKTDVEAAPRLNRKVFDVTERATCHIKVASRPHCCMLPTCESFWIYQLLGLSMPSVLWRCWLGGRKGIRSVKNRAVGCRCGCLSGAKCRLAYGPADATATHCFSKIQIGFTFLVPAHPGSSGKRAVKCVCVRVRVCVLVSACLPSIVPIPCRKLLHPIYTVPWALWVHTRNSISTIFAVFLCSMFRHTHNHATVTVALGRILTPSDVPLLNLLWQVETVEVSFYGYILEQ